ncbi:MAG: aspartate aminotransferase family protein, partial [Cytophagales bacterium]
MKFWRKLTAEERLAKVQQALKDNVDFSKDANLGYPASRLDEKVFTNESLFLR